jgi:hypothetical protein
MLQRSRLVGWVVFFVYGFFGMPRPAHLTAKHTHAVEPAAADSGEVSASPEYTPACWDWQPVSLGAFGLPSGFDGANGLAGLTYADEEGFEVQVFAGALYVGMEADNLLGARLWRSRPGFSPPRSQADWQEVIADAAGNPFGDSDRSQNDHVDSLAVFRDELYVSIANRSNQPSGVRLYRSRDGGSGSWQEASGSLGAGFGDPNNENFKDMQVFDGRLCGGTWNEADGAEVWCTPDGNTWELKNTPGYGDSANQVIWSGEVFAGGLYFGVQNHGRDPQDPADDRAAIYRAFDLDGMPAWEQVYDGPPGSYAAALLPPFQDRLYAAIPGAGGVTILASASGGPGSWQPASRPGIDGTPANFSVVVDGGAEYNGWLYMAASNLRQGVSIYRTDGRAGEDGLLDWQRSSLPGLQPGGGGYANLAVFGGRLYAWVTSYRDGQRVYQMICPVCERRAVDGPGEIRLETVGAQITLASGSLAAVEVCAFPEAFPAEAGSGAAALPGYFEVRTLPAEAHAASAVSLSFPGLRGMDPGTAPAYALSRVRAGRLYFCPVEFQRLDFTAGQAGCGRVSSPAGTWMLLPAELAGSAQPGATTGQAGRLALGGAALAVTLLLAAWRRRKIGG